MTTLLLLAGCFTENRVAKTEPEPDTEVPDDSATTPPEDTACTPVDWYADADEDGFGDPNAVTAACARPAGTVENDRDCDDGDAAVFPGALEICNGGDDDCDGAIDEDPTDPETWWADADGDGHGDAGAPVTACDAPEGYVDTDDDCDDAEGAAYPGGVEICDDVDNDCDGTVDTDECVCGGDPAPGLVVTIVESSHGSGHMMDTIWSDVVSGLGHVPTIVSQATLDDVANLADTDVLIVSSGTDTLSDARADTIEAFVEAGGSVYLQGEYLSTYGTNVAFERIVDDLGGSFSWVGTVSGDLNPMPVSGCIAENPNLVDPLDYHWYACEGTGVPAFMTWAGKDVAFHFCPADRSMGAVIQSTDQDWINQAGTYSGHTDVLENIFTALATHPLSCP